MQPKKPLRIRTERSQEPWNASAKRGRENAYTRGLKNRIVELEKQIAKLSTGNQGNQGNEVRIHTTEQVLEFLETFVKTGFWGDSVEEAAEQMLRERLRAELLIEGGYR